MQALLIILLCIFSAIIYGILHDQITARICLEYFTIGHRHILDTTSPTLLALTWGILATWWVGLLLGILLAIAARAGKRFGRNAASLLKPIVLLLVVMGGCAIVAGAIGHILASKKIITLPDPLAFAIPPHKHVPYLTDWFAHLASYASGLVGGVILAIWTWNTRAQKNSSSEPPTVALSQRV
jgi:hypothetical protein